ncbi:putative RNA-directed DNA polymerase [Helianthus annuus]|nr:putative RNA-directed DNA polymerase [Helianthus annuus]
MDVLSCMMKKACSICLFKGIKINTHGPLLSHFLFADDVLFLGEWSSDNAAALKRILRCFYFISGLKINLQKSSLFGIGIGEHALNNMAMGFGCKVGTFPFVHLGLPVGGNMNLVRNWTPVVDKFRNRLSLWKARHLSIGGRITLLKTVLNALPTYYFSLFRAPAQVIKSLDRLRRNFFWGGDENVDKMSWVAWAKVIGPVDYGGIGIGSLADANLAMLAKWWWRFKSEQNALWRKVIWSIHSSSRSWLFIPMRLSNPGPWKQITGIENDLNNQNVCLIKAIKGSLGNGSSILFWHDVWAGSDALCSTFPNLYAIEQCKWCVVADRLVMGNNGINFLWRWRRVNLSQQEIQELNDIRALLCSVSLLPGKDQWIWGLDTTEIFSVKSIKLKIIEGNNNGSRSMFSWNNWVPKKVCIVAWRACQDRLPTVAALRRRNITTQNPMCRLCGDFEESMEHMFVSCQFSQLVWQVISQWCHVTPIYAFEFRDLLLLYQTMGGSKKQRKAFYAVVLTALWSLWRSRNNAVFNNKSPQVAGVIEETKSLSFLWVKNRSKSRTLSWEAWRKFDLAALV